MRVGETEGGGQKGKWERRIESKWSVGEKEGKI